MATTHRVNVETLPGGELILSNPTSPENLQRSMVHVLLDRAAATPDATLVAERGPDGEWIRLTYAAAVEQCRSVAQWFLDRRAESGDPADRPMAILSPASIQHFLLAWGAQMARVPYVPVSASYSTVPGAFPKLESVLGRVNPFFVFSEDLDAVQAALDSIAFDRSGRVFIGDAASDDKSVAMAEILATPATGDVDQSIDLIDHDTVTRYMFTSGSTGMPKGVVHNHGMACHMLAGGMARGGRQRGDVTSPMRVLDWMPWSHVGAGVMRLNGVVDSGGSVYLDAGRPVAGQFEPTIANLIDVKPNNYSGAPLGWAVLADALEANEELASVFFANVEMFQFGSAAMPAALAERLGNLYNKYTGGKLTMGTSLAATEVSLGLARTWPTDDLDVIGLPSPGATAKLLPLGEGRYEIRMKSGGITPGYLHDPKKTEAAFDEDGFYVMGDAVRFRDPDDPDRGLVFAGRVSEDFKLVSGTWVNAGALRSQTVAATSPLVRDAVVCGLNEGYVALLIWPNIDQCEAIANGEDLFRSQAVRDAIAGGLRAHNKANPGSSQSIKRFLLLSEPPDQGAHEITEKGYVNQGAVQRRRAKDVERLFADEPDDAVYTV